VERSHQTRAAANRSSALAPSGSRLLQRTCACGQHTGGGECASCKQKRGWLQRQPAQAPEPAQTSEPAPGRAAFEGCEAPVAAELLEATRTAKVDVDRAIGVLGSGWRRMPPAEQGLFNRFFDPAGSGEVDESFVRDVRANFARIRQGLDDLHFNCQPEKGVIFGLGSDKCAGGRRMWTALGTVYVCPAFSTSKSFKRKVKAVIHETAHNALKTTDRAYASSPDFGKLSPRGSGVLSVLSQIPVLGALFKLLPGNTDSLNNPDSYGHFAVTLQNPAEPTFADE
jgi:hypothetical protein